MLEVDWTKDEGWGTPKIVPYGPVEMATSATALHYGISVHEGITVIENKDDGKLQGFRVDEHLDSLVKSSDHLDMPTFDASELKSCLGDLLQLDKEWAHIKQGEQLYTRIVHFSTDKTLGVRTPQNTKIVAMINPIMLSNRPISLKCSHNVFKNWPLGHGRFRVSGNLGPLIPSVTDAKMNGFDDVLWLLDDYIKEMTILNVFTLI